MNNYLVVNRRDSLKHDSMDKSLGTIDPLDMKIDLNLVQMMDVIIVHDDEHFKILKHSYLYEDETEMKSIHPIGHLKFFLKKENNYHLKIKTGE
jgi:hypothetical protein